MADFKDIQDAFEKEGFYTPFKGVICAKCSFAIGCEKITREEIINGESFTHIEVEYWMINSKGEKIYKLGDKNHALRIYSLITKGI